MVKGFFENPILNFPYEEPDRHHALDDKRQPLNLSPVSGRIAVKVINHLDNEVIKVFGG